MVSLRIWTGASTFVPKLSPVGNVQWYTPMLAWWLPQRTFVYGFAVGMAVLLLVIAGVRAPPPALSPFLIASSGSPFNVTTAQDPFRDSQFNQRAAFAPCSPVNQTPYGCFDSNPKPGEKIVPINFLTGPGRFTLNLRLSKSFGFGKKAEVANAGPGGGPGGFGGPAQPGQLVAPFVQERLKLTDEQKKELFTGVVRGERQLAYCLTEPESGSDAAAMRSRAVRDGDSWVLNGQKIFATKANLAAGVFSRWHRQKLKDRVSGDRLPASALADKPERFSAGDVKAHGLPTGPHRRVS